VGDRAHARGALAAAATGARSSNARRCAIESEDLAANGTWAAGRAPDHAGSGVLTHCNTGRWPPRSSAPRSASSAPGGDGPDRTRVRRRDAALVAGRAPDRLGLQEDGIPATLIADAPART
jgi:hypothetical protein